MTSSLRRVQRSILLRGVTESVQGRLDPALGRLRAARNLRRRARVRNAFALSRTNAAKLGVMVADREDPGSLKMTSLEPKSVLPRQSPEITGTLVEFSTRVDQPAQEK
ncbi:hypothetical protein D3C87_1567130 [compost metagenome]